MGKQKSKAWKLDKDFLQKLIDESASIAEVCRKLNINPHNGASKTLYRRIKEWNEFDFTKMKANFRIKVSSQNVKKTYNDCFIENSECTRKTIKRIINQNKLIEYKCNDCSNIGFHNEKLLSLQLEHKNGISNDNRLENLCFLCPNCHSQTETYAGKNAKSQQKELANKMKQQRRIKRIEDHKSKIELVLNSNIDFSKWGWKKQVGKLLEIKHQKVSKWLKTHMPDLYQKY